MHASVYPAFGLSEAEQRYLRGVGHVVHIGAYLLCGVLVYPCKRCGHPKPLSEFTPHGKRAAHICDDCKSHKEIA